MRFRQAYATVPETLPSHASMFTGLYPGGHGVHENARYVPANLPLAAERLQQAGYRTSAVVSSFVLTRRFGLARGFDVYDDQLPAGRNERSAREATDAAIAELVRPLGAEARLPTVAQSAKAGSAKAARFLWVHYYDPHTPYAPPEPYQTRYAKRPYLGEVAAMDEQLGRLVQAFERQAKGPVAIAIAADHGEGLGDHGESQHGDLLYQSTMRVPLVLMGPGVAAGVSDRPVSTRRIFHTLMDWAGVGAGAPHSLKSAGTGQEEVVLGEAMKPFLEYGWQPQVMAASGRFKAILAGRLETYDVTADPGERHDLANSVALPPGMRNALEEYPVPSPDVARRPENLDAEARRRLASLGYVGSTATPVVRKEAPRPAAMMPLLAKLEEASTFFGAGRFTEAVPLLDAVLAADPFNLDAALRLATAHSSLGHEQKALDGFQRAAAIAPKSQDVRTYLALHFARTKDWERAVPLLEQVVTESPERLTAVEALAALKARQGQQAMDAGRTAEAIAGFERARALQPEAFKNDLELGVLYLAARRYADARTALDRTLSLRPNDAMALFKRAQVSVLLNEPDRATRIALARERADATTAAIIAREQLFKK